MIGLNVRHTCWAFAKATYRNLLYLLWIKKVTTNQNYPRDNRLISSERWYW
jgi:hypothetical protein